MKLLSFLRRLGQCPQKRIVPPAEPHASGPQRVSPPSISPSDPAGITFYTVYIPTLDGRFYYLSDTDHPPGEIVRIPFGHQDQEIFGIVEKSQCFPYGKTPLPMWKMKYILGKAPEPIAEEYRRQKNRLTSREAGVPERS